MTSDKSVLIVDLARLIIRTLPAWFSRLFLVGGLVLGLILYWYIELEKRISHRLPLEQDGTEIIMIGVVEGVERLSSGSYRLTISIDSLLSSSLDGEFISLPFLQLLRVNYYPGHSLSSAQSVQYDLSVGRRGVFHVKLKAFRNFYNPVGFDFEYWALANGLDTGGYVKVFSLLEPANAGRGWPLDKASGWRSIIVDRAQALPGLAGQLVPALLLGQGSALDGRYWSDLQLVGAVHLLVVSGLHLGFWVIGIVAIWGVLRRVVASVFVMTPLMLIRIEPLVLVTIAAGYCTLAGWGISLQRAFLMMLIAIFLLYRTGRSRLVLVYWAALLAIVLSAPLATLLPGFMYSFAAVLILMFTFNGRPIAMPFPLLAMLLKAQLVLGVGMLAVYWQFSQPQSLHALVVNLIAVPLLGLLVLPASILVFLLPTEGLIAAYNQGLGFLLHHLANSLPEALDLLFEPQGVWLLPLFTTALWLISPRGFGFKVIFTLLIVIVCWVDFNPDEDRLIVMDTGQGLSVLVSSSGHKSLYDTGAAFSSGFSVGERVVAPNLRQFGIKNLNQVVVSHSDNDHAGGLSGVMRYVAVEGLISGQSMDSVVSDNCRLFTSVWQETADPAVQWRVFGVEEQGIKNTKDNNQSCVVQYRIGKYRVLLPGDIESSVENKLVAKYGEELKSNVLVAGHHGSKTSTSLAWLMAVAPDYAVISAGFNNRFGHPHQQVVKRLNDYGVVVLNTAELGAIEFNIADTLNWFSWRQGRKSLWSQN